MRSWEMEPEMEGKQEKLKKTEEYNNKANTYLIRVSEKKMELKIDTLLSGFYAAEINMIVLRRART